MKPNRKLAKRSLPGNSCCYFIPPDSKALILLSFTLIRHHDCLTASCCTFSPLICCEISEKRKTPHPSERQSVLQPRRSSRTTEPLDTTGKTPGLLFVCKILNKMPETVCALRPIMAVAVEKTQILLNVLSYRWS